VSKYTVMQKKEEVVRNWYEIDAEGKVLGKLATEIAVRLMGKHKPSYTPHVDGGDFVIITNADKIASTSLGSAVCETVLPLVPLQPLETIERSIQKKYRSALWTPFVRALKEFEMVKDGDRIAVAISGGKDSLLLSKLFQELKRASRTNFELIFISMNPGFEAIDVDKFKENLIEKQYRCRTILNIIYFIVRYFV